MSFISIVLAYCLSRFTRLANWVQNDALFEYSFQWANRLLPPKWVLAGLLVIGCGVLALLLYSLPVLLALILGVLVFLYSLGRGDWRAALAGDEAVWRAQASSGEAASDEAASWARWVSHATSRCFDDLFAVFFWFFLLGPLGAMAYRITMLYSERVAKDADHQTQSTEQTDAVLSIGRALPSCAGAVHALMWLPARYMGLCLCLAGNFTTGFAQWRSLLLDTFLKPAQYLGRMAQASLLSEENDTDPRNSQAAYPLFATYADNLRNLLARTELIGLVGIAVLVLLRF